MTTQAGGPRRNGAAAVPHGAAGPKSCGTRNPLIYISFLTRRRRFRKKPNSLPRREI